VLALVFGEAILLCVSAAIIGLAGAVAMFPQMKAVVGVASLPPQVVALGIGLAVLLALLIGAWPAARVRRMSIVDSLAGR
jgi:ABC-type antimicrobial peptide transport system permease subunit